MSVATESYVMQIGEAAGAVYQTLAAEGPITQAKLVKDLGLPRDLIMQAVGWLAREDKITVDEGRTRKLALR